MKKHIWLWVGLMVLALRAVAAPSMEQFEKERRFIFYAVLEGCYEDGVSTEDVSQILLLGGPRTNEFAHFVYACPICMPTIHALQAYEARPKQFYGMKRRGSTFGGGLAEDVRKQLYSSNPEEQLTAINALMRRWISQRMELLRLSDSERAELQKTFEQMRKKGMDYLKSAQSAPPTLVSLKQCAVCNGTCQLPLKPENGK